MSQDQMRPPDLGYHLADRALIVYPDSLITAAVFVPASQPASQARASIDKVTWALPGPARYVRT
ncbi:hypothetical protein W59_02496 [Rhodococcus opacus RKJ300 = JCM 13270]|uniref:Uncharacterized protein n=1 Tax=Rhodococcus opacus RKJ300 = JCM 13270 TaxID=1165867 RepID=I0WYX0_RHOOP|nr:hypothetical protein W59_02496 [Rhodococcus opacus RKJ300 = JCM 13270]